MTPKFMFANLVSPGDHLPGLFFRQALPKTGRFGDSVYQEAIPRITSRMLKKSLLFDKMSVVRARHARNRSSAGARVQLFVAGGASSEGPSAAGGAGNDRGGSEGYVVTVRRDVRATGSAVDPSREASAGAVIADSLLSPIGATADGRDRLQHAVPLVCWSESGRGGVGRHHVHQESGSAAGSRRGEGISGEGGGAGAERRADLG